MNSAHSKWTMETVQITSADPAQLMNILSDNKIMIFNVLYKDELTAKIDILHKDVAAVTQIAENRGDTCKILNKAGFVQILRQIPKRMVLIAVICALFALTLYIPSRIFFIEVYGNDTVSTALLLEKLEQCGIGFGSVRAAISNENIKNYLLQDIKELSWIGITTTGCIARVEVRENEKSENHTQQQNIGSIVAATDGLVDEITVIEGTALCRPGQAVKAGQVLISGYEDHGLIIKANAAKGEVYANTLRYTQAYTPVCAALRGCVTGKKVIFSLQVGKKLIKFSKDSSISPEGCVKIYKKIYLSLPGGFKLPVCVVLEEYISYETKYAELNDEDYEWLRGYVRSYVKDMMIAGQILQEQSEAVSNGATAVFKTVYYCREQIGKRKYEEIPN